MPIERVFEFLDYQVAHYPQEKAFGSRANGQWNFYSINQIMDSAKRLAQGLMHAGYLRGDNIAIISYKNQPEWIIADLAIQYAGMVSVPLYPTISPSEYEYILKEAECKAAFIGEGDLEQKVNDIRSHLPGFKQIIGLDEGVGTMHWKSMLRDDLATEVNDSINMVKPADLMTIIYTSGTTGKPKGVMLSHLNLASNVRQVKDLLPVKPGERAISFLPVCHIFERAATYAFIYFGLSVYQTGTDNLGGDSGDLKSVKPHFFTCVPRLLEKVYEKIYNKGAELTGIKKKLFFWALSLTDQYEFDFKPSGLDAIKWAIADKLIFSKWREALGGSVKGIVTGSAPCPAKIIRVFSAAGIPVREAYGLTEASPGISFNEFHPYKAIIGTVGPLLPEVEVRLDNSEGIYKEGDGEILAAGENIMLGYYHQPQWTADVIKEIDGKIWLCTGDVGTFVIGNDGTKFLKITDRKKELFKTSGGKYVAPAPIESKIKEDFMIDNVMLVGDGLKFVSALIVPVEQGLMKWCADHQISWTNMEDICKHPKVIELYQSIVDKYNPLFGHIEQIKKFKLIPEVWQPIKADGSEGELTPTLKLKRRLLKAKYASLIEGMYAE
ncbi:MAG: long-chain fatty acid--CoA ligase [Saprospiraceae bacterium]|nr:long-chain fatty acid--CoA ligase [Saprospiraceae bacterium]MBK7435436.1 long-chain fatty acid--CoA ligase [Saprospiraceae bacterium]MBK9681102.1 long-chain fatty acid--CoA ligase [Saprospiraceae bacterium]MBK9930088.1 long-chain fatty acid--CoA ligase [Saprospiraceae bacterium]MBL0113049.1 long-chain fatty acid--CoA ligase [Saprospiraceae bacterium]